MKSPQYWVDQFNRDFIVPDSVPEEATHNCISESFVKQIQEDARLPRKILLSQLEDLRNLFFAALADGNWAEAQEVVRKYHQLAHDTLR